MKVLNANVWLENKTNFYLRVENKATSSTATCHIGCCACVLAEPEIYMSCQSFGTFDCP